jgi:hypothetical protein
MDYGIEITSIKAMDWCRFSTSEISFIDPPSPWQNAYMEPFNDKLCDDFLDEEISLS